MLTVDEFTKIHHCLESVQTTEPISLVIYFRNNHLILLWIFKIDLFELKTSRMKHRLGWCKIHKSFKIRCVMSISSIKIFSRDTSYWAFFVTFHHVETCLMILWSSNPELLNWKIIRLKDQSLTIRSKLGQSWIKSFKRGCVNSWKLAGVKVIHTDSWQMFIIKCFSKGWEILEFISSRFLLFNECHLRFIMTDVQVTKLRIVVNLSNSFQILTVYQPSIIKSLNMQTFIIFDHSVFYFINSFWN